MSQRVLKVGSLYFMENLLNINKRIVRKKWCMDIITMGVKKYAIIHLNINR